MKPRVVFITLELLTSSSLRYLRARDTWTDLEGFVQIEDAESYVEQVQVNVAKPKPAGKRRAKR